MQAGHQNTTTGATGAPGEMEENIRFRYRLGQILINKGFQVFLADANFKATEDYDLALAIHGDADIYGTGGGFVDYPDPSVDMSDVESRRIKEAIESQYFNHSGIVNHPERSNANTKFYYWWSWLTAKTPCVIIECGVVQDAYDKVLLADTDRICNAIARGICVAFNVPFDSPPTPPPVNPCADLQIKYDALQKDNADLTNKNDQLNASVTTLTARVAFLEEQVAPNPPECHDAQIRPLVFSGWYTYLRSRSKIQGLLS